MSTPRQTGNAARLLLETSQECSEPNAARGLQPGLGQVKQGHEGMLLLYLNLSSGVADLVIFIKLWALGNLEDIIWTGMQ